MTDYIDRFRAEAHTIFYSGNLTKWRKWKRLFAHRAMLAKIARLVKEARELRKENAELRAWKKQYEENERYLAWCAEQ